MREYLSVADSSKQIAGEVAQYGSSKDWSGDQDLAKEVERHLSKFNIGYTDPKGGGWSHKTGGTRYFATMKFMNFAKNKVNDLVSSIKKK
jgi:hypothetical protein